MKRLIILFSLLIIAFMQGYAQEIKHVTKKPSVVKAKNPVYTIDGIKQISSVAFSVNNVDPENIESVKVLNRENAIALFGPEAINGAILLTTKKGKNNPENIELDNKLTALNLEQGITQLANIPYQSKQEPLKGRAIISLKDSDNNTFTGLKHITDILYILDGQEIEKGDMQFLNPETIQSITILKTGAALAAYGAKGKNGVVLITSKLPKIELKSDPSKKQ
jgi:TonB-dependent SusC/RagA subfamily outer membrane receptor